MKDICPNDFKLEDVEIRPETASDYRQVEDLAFVAFDNYMDPEALGSHDNFEPFFIHQDRNDSIYINELSLVACYKGKVIGYSFCVETELRDTKIKKNFIVAQCHSFAVDPNFRHRGVGSLLTKSLIEAAKNKGYRALVVGTNPPFPLKFGFKSATRYSMSVIGENSPLLLVYPFAEHIATKDNIKATTLKKRSLPFNFYAKGPFNLLDKREKEHRSIQMHKDVAKFNKERGYAHKEPTEHELIDRDILSLLSYSRMDF